MRSALAFAILSFAAACAHPGAPRGEATTGEEAKPCSACHGESLGAQRKQRSVHAVLRDEGACARCHLPHDTARTAYPTHPEPKLCNACHGDRAFMRPHGGEKGTSQCTRCHAPHASDQPRLLRGSAATLCGACHQGLAKAHSGYPVEGTRCTGCHQVHGGGSALLNPLVHEVASDCTNCHAAASSERPLATQKPVPALCLDCHPDVGAKIAKLAAPHPPARDGACTACHAPHSSAVDGLLAGPMRDVCGGCHTAVIEATRRSQPHKPAAEGRCGDCHLAHGGPRPKLLAKPADELCTGCHPIVETWAARKHVHAPLQMGDCSACHDPHGGARKLLKAEAAPLCLRCHAAGKEGFVLGSHVHAPEPKGDCLSCHDPHASDAPRLVTRGGETLCRGCHEATVATRRDRGEKLHTPFAGGNCAACHTPHAGGKAGLRPGDVCVDCHVGTRQTWTKGRSVHPPFVGGACQDCHDAHGSKQRAMLRQPAATLCTGCHAEVKGDAEKAGAIVHEPVRTGACLDCHGGHGSTQPDLLRHDPPTLCAECHDVGGASAVTKHGGYAVAGADCTGCHLPHAGPKPRLVRGEEHMPFGSGGCAACHERPASPPAPAKLKPGGLEPCAECHDFKGMTKAAGAHGPIADGRCFGCHAPHVGEGKALLKALGVALCKRCHDPRRWESLPAHVKAGGSLGECEKCHPHHAPKASAARRR